MLRHCSRLLTRNGVNLGIRYAGKALDARQNELMDRDKLILVNTKDEYVGEMSKREAHLWKNIETDKALHRAFSVFLFNDNKELLLQKRAQTKVTFPGVWANTCCSHPLHIADEMETGTDAIGVRRAAHRKLAQELGIRSEEVPVDKLRFIARILYKAQDGQTEWGEHELDYILFIRANVVPFPNLNEVEATQYVSKNGLKMLIKKCEEQPGLMNFSPWFLLLVKHCLFEWWDHLDDLDKLVNKKEIINYV